MLGRGYKQLLGLWPSLSRGQVSRNHEKDCIITFGAKM